MANTGKRIEDLFEAALRLPPGQRPQFLEETCPGDAELRRALVSLLDSADSADTLLQDPPLRFADQRSLSRGHKLERFEILELLGRGGMGDVYRARDLRLKRDVALKVLPSHVARDPANVARFEREARAASALSHPNIVQIYDIGHNDGIDWIASELVSGHTLRQVMKGGALPVGRAIGIAMQIADGLAAAHAAGVVHRDLNPGNVMLTPEGRAKILDFGLAKRDPALAGASETLKTAVTMPGLMMGTPGYMAPEQILGKPADARADIFSLGVIVYELLSGKPAFSGSSVIQVINENLKNEVEELPLSLPLPLKRIVHRCLDNEPSCRFQSGGCRICVTCGLGDRHRRPTGRAETRHSAQMDVDCYSSRDTRERRRLLGTDEGGRRPCNTVRPASFTAPFYTAPAKYFFFRLQFRHLAGRPTARLRCH